MKVLVIAWSMVAAVCLTLAVMQAVTWLNRRTSFAPLLFSLTALAAAGNAVTELVMLQAETVETYAAAMKAEVLFAGVLLIGLAWFVKSYFGTTRKGVAEGFTIAWIVLLGINFLSPYGLVYADILSLQSVSLPWGEPYAVASGKSNPWNVLANVLPLVLMAYVVDASVRVWKAGHRRRAATIGGAIVFFLFAAGLQATLVDHGLLRAPYLVSFSYLAIVLAMGYELSRDVARAADLSQQVAADERRWRSLLESVELAIVEVDARGRIVRINPYAERVTGYRMDELAGRPIADLVPRSTAGELGQRFDQAIRTHPRAHSTWPIVCATGEERLFSWSTIRFLTQSGEPALLSVGADVTVQRQAEQALRDERERMSIVLATLNTGLVLMDRDLTVTWANPLLRSMFPGEELEGRKCYAVAEKRTAPCEGCQAVLALDDGRVHEREFRNAQNERWYHVVALPIKDENGAVIGVLEATTDVNERKVMEEALRESEEKFREFFRSTPDYCFITSPEGTIIDVNEAVVRSLGYRREDLLGRPLASLAAPESASSLDVLFRRHTQNGQIMNEQAVILAANGERRTVLISAGIVHRQDGTVQYTASIQTDITQLMQTMEAHDRTLAELRALKERLEEENIYLRHEIEVDRGFREIIGASNAILYVLNKIEQVAKTDAAVLIEGETGVGKELVARAIHSASDRSAHVFIKVDCTALPANLVESELFGHERGAFTGAESLRKGRFELADGGTIFLDEISELAPELQAKLLRVLQEKQFERVGGSRTQTVDVRIIAATNRNLDSEVAAGRFRADLYYRLNVYPITVPPLRQRREDIPLLVEHFVPTIAAKIGKSVNQVPPYVMEQLIRYEWPGNIRELRNCLERAVIASNGDVLRVPDDMVKPAPETNGEPKPVNESLATLDEMERRHIRAVLDATGWRISGPKGAAEVLGINPSTLRFRMKKLGIQQGT